MAGVNFSKPLLGAGASAKTEFAAAQARTGLNFIGSARFKRGIKAELGVAAFAEASAAFSKFIHASVEGTAFAEARAGIQLQLPLNLFDEFGFSARAEAIAQAAAGVQVDLGLNIGDFVKLAQESANLSGLPLELLIMFLEEVSIGGAFEVNVSASAKAHASVSVSGTVIEKGGEKAGFYYTVDAGVGLAAGVGMGLKAGAEFEDFRRFYGRAVDKAVDSAIAQVTGILPKDLHLFSNNDQLAPYLEAFAPVAKLALRTAYDIGLKISENNPGTSKSDMATLCNEAIKTFLEEAQRFTLNKLLDTAFASLRKLLEQQIQLIGQVKWDAALNERNKLADHLLEIPEEPYQASQENIDYWTKLVELSVNLVVKIGNPDRRLMETISIVYCASELLMEAVRARVNTASAYAMAIGAGTVTADTKPFKGQLNNQPSDEIKKTITGNSRNLTYPDLLQFLLNDLVIDPALNAVPGLKKFMNIFAPGFQKTEKQILKLFLENAGAFDPANPGSAQVDPHALLTTLVSAIDSFVTDHFRNDVLPQVLENISDENLKLYVEEVLFEAVVYMKDVGLHSLLNWNDPNRTFENDDFTEALAGVMMLLLGRTVVIVADTFVTATQAKIETHCKTVAQKIRDQHSDTRILNLPADPDLVRLVSDCVEIAGKVLGPLPVETRKRVRHLLYQVFEPIAPANEQSFLEDLGDQFFIPNLTQLQQLTNELAGISKDRFALFVEKFVERTGEYLLELLEEFILRMIDLVVNWEKHLAEALAAIAAFLRNLEEEMTRLNNELIDLMQTATNGLHELFEQLSGPGLRSSLKREIKQHFVDKGLDALEGNDLYKNLPGEIKTAIRGLVSGAVDNVMNSPLLDPVFNAIRKISNQLDNLLPDVRELDPEENLPAQLMELVLDKIEDNIREHFGGEKPHVLITLDYKRSVWVYDPPFSGHWETRHTYIPLGKIEIKINPYLDLVRNVIERLDFYHDKLNAVCIRLGNALSKELELAAAILQRDQKKEEQSRLARISNEHNNTAKEIAILNPVNFAHYTNTIDVKIHLGGVPMSYLGLGKDEIQRVLIYINGHLVPNKTLVTEGKLETGNNRTELADHDFTRLAELDLSGNISSLYDVKTGVIKKGKATIITDTGLSFARQEKNKTAGPAGSLYALSQSGIQEQPVSKSVYANTVRNEKSSAMIKKAITKDKNGKMVNVHQVDQFVPGRKITPSQLNEILKEQLPGIFVQFKLGLDESFVTEGVNSITVVVIEKGGNRHQQQVNFTVTQPAHSTKPVPGVINIIDEKTGKPKPGTITLKGIFGDHLAKNKKNISAETAKSFGEIINRENKTILKKPAPVTVKSAGEKVTTKKETIAVFDKNGKKTGTHELMYVSAGERETQLQKLGLDKKQLLRSGGKTGTAKISYETKAGKENELKVNRAYMVNTADLKKKLQAGELHFKQQSEMNFKDKLPIKK